ncbi:Tyrosine-protein phosphatase non-receptor type 13 [Boothiomyces sp. JEL0866]|nr:Tyrosine-protein phosphatase non-receptor type 13 [Boothiomyces sp. JEL0866]
MSKSIQQSLQEQVAQFQQIQKEYDQAVQNRTALESQLKENEQVSIEFGLLKEESNIYKMIGPCLVKQDRVEAVSNVKKRIEYITGEIKRSEQLIKDLQEKQEKKKLENRMGNYQSVEDDSVHKKSSIVINKDETPEIEIAATQEFSVSYKTELEKAGINAHFERVSPVPQISLPLHSFEEEKHSIQITSPVEILKIDSLKRTRNEEIQSNSAPDSIQDAEKEIHLGSPPIQSLAHTELLQPVNQYSYVSEDIKRTRHDKGVTLPALKKPSLLERRARSNSVLVNSSLRRNNGRSISLEIPKSVPISIPDLKPPRLDTQKISKIAAQNLEFSPLSANSAKRAATTLELCSMLHKYHYLPIWYSETVKTVNISQIKEKINLIYNALNEMEKTRLRDEYSTYSLKIGSQQENKMLNRYSDALPFDHSRVILNTEGSDYINASHLTSLDGKKTYIAAQGPVPQSFGDFWQMVWEQNTAVIVMLTKEEEQGRIKCHRYWPEEIGNSKRYHKITKTNSICFKISHAENFTIMNGNLIVREFIVKREMLLKDDLSEAPELKRIRMIQYTAWPDHDSSDPRQVLSLIDVSNEINRQAEQDYIIHTTSPETRIGPMVVHCSAGLGRTASFCTIDSVLGLLKSGFTIYVPGELPSNDLVAHTINHFRKERCGAVQTKSQLQFCYDAIIMRVGDWYYQGVPVTWPIVDKLIE